MLPTYFLPHLKSSERRCVTAPGARRSWERVGAGARSCVYLCQAHPLGRAGALGPCGPNKELFSSSTGRDIAPIRPSAFGVLGSLLLSFGPYCPSIYTCDFSMPLSFFLCSLGSTETTQPAAQSRSIRICMS